ncbi:hypothetical protein M8J77_008499 [Diaphorina citri]|nr:hypothetical protein M8J77_008499 [Diaphorina citri]
MKINVHLGTLGSESTRLKPVLLVISLAGIKVCSPDGKSVYMAHALKRISYATSDPNQLQFCFVARQPKGHFSQQFCHTFLTKTAEQLGEHSSIMFIINTVHSVRHYCHVAYNTANNGTDDSLIQKFMCWY